MLHILHTPVAHATPWWRTDERWPEAAGKVIWTDCCACKMPAAETDVSFRSWFDMPHGGMGGEQFPAGTFVPFDYPAGAYFERSTQVRCAEGYGCTVNPRRKRGSHLREAMRWGC